MHKQCTIPWNRNIRSPLVLSGAAALALALLLALAPAAHANHNDALADAVLISGSFGSEQHWNGGATLETGEPTTTEDGPSTIDATVWYSWTAPGGGPATFTTCNNGTGGDTTLGVYTGAAVGSLTTVGANNDMGAACTNTVITDPAITSEVSFTAVAGTTYHIQVGNPLGDTVDFQLTWTSTGGDPTTVDDCKNGGWAAYGFSNQGRCIQFVNTGKDSR